MKQVSVKRKVKVSRRLWSKFVVMLTWYFKSSSVTPQRLIASLLAIPSGKSSWEQRNFSQGIMRPIFNSPFKWLLNHSSGGVWYAIEDLYGCNREAVQRSTQPQLCSPSRFEAVRVLWWCEVLLVSKKERFCFMYLKELKIYWSNTVTIIKRRKTSLKSSSQSANARIF